MQHKMTYYPLGNADSCLIQLDNGRRLLFDYANLRNQDDKLDLRANLPEELLKTFSKDDAREFDVVAFTHADDDHVHGASDFFYLEHAKKYQGDDRIKMKELWVPAAFVLESGLSGDAGAIRQEARHRLKNGKGVRVFSRPQLLKEWLEENGLKIEDRAELITDAGTLVSGFDLPSDNFEVFSHSPFGWRIEKDVEDRNSNGLVVQLSFQTKTRVTRAILGSDTEWEAWDQIVSTTLSHKNEARLEWDIFKVSHHCSFTALAADKGKDMTEPCANISCLFGKGSQRAVLVATCYPIPSDDNDDQPPHRQAAAYYKEVATNFKGFFKVTMETPNATSPQPLVILITDDGATVEKSVASLRDSVIVHTAPRAGHER